MKLNIKPKAEAPKEKKKPGPETQVGGERFNFFPGDSLDRLDKLNSVYRRLGVPKITRSFALREGVADWIERKINEAKKAEKGELHAKKRE